MIATSRQGLLMWEIWFSAAFKMKRACINSILDGKDLSLLPKSQDQDPIDWSTSMDWKYLIHGISSIYGSSILELLLGILLIWISIKKLSFWLIIIRNSDQEHLPASITVTTSTTNLSLFSQSKRHGLSSSWAKRHALYDPRDKFSIFPRSCYSNNYFEYQPFFVRSKSKAWPIE